MSKIRKVSAAWKLSTTADWKKIHLLKGVKSSNVSAAYDQKPKKEELHRISRLEKYQHLLAIRAGNQQLKWERVAQLKGKTVDKNQQLVKNNKKISSSK
jgi:hypothetical protein